MGLSDWDQWNELEGNPDQQKRLKSAQKAECTPLSIDIDAKKGSFSGSHGSYNTTLTSCSCVDFMRRKKPCKHMYRLAIELGIIEATVKSDQTQVKKPTPPGLKLADAVAQVEALSEDNQQVFHAFLLEHLYHKRNHVALPKDTADVLTAAGLVVPVEDPEALLFFYKRNELMGRVEKAGLSLPSRNMKLDRLVDWCLENIADIPSLCGNVVALELAPAMLKTIRKVYTYLVRKFDWDTIINPKTGDMMEVPKGASFSIEASMGESNRAKIAFPDDEVTALLTQYGCNRCQR